MSQYAHKTTPKKQDFSVAPSVQRADNVMRKLILSGGLGVLFAVSGLFFFLAFKIYPLFRQPTVSTPISLNSGIADPLLAGSSSDGNLLFVLSSKGVIRALPSRQFNASQEARDLHIPLKEISTAKWDQESQKLLLGTPSGRILEGVLELDPLVQNPTDSLSFAWRDPVQLAQMGTSLTDIDKVSTSRRTTYAGLANDGTRQILEVLTVEQSPSPFNTNPTPSARHLRASVTELSPHKVLLGPLADLLIVLTAQGQLVPYHLNDDRLEKYDPYSLFPQLSTRVVSIHPVQGRQSFYLTDDKGIHHIATLRLNGETGRLELSIIASFPGGESPLQAYSASPANKALLLATQDSLILRHATTKKTRWRQPLEQPVKDIVISSQYEDLIVLDSSGRLSVFPIDDPHPEAGWSAFFRKISYEGYREPAYIWQSTGGNDAFEEKISLIPLLFGSFKGALFSMLFSIPIALAAAIYTSQFLHPKLRAVVKPSVELMASFPSVVLGVIAAIWLGPLLEERIPSFLIACLALPSAALLGGFVISNLPKPYTSRIPSGCEFIILFPLLATALCLSWHVGPIVEGLLFTVKDPVSGQSISDFRLWWESYSNTPYQRRNALSIGLVMGFAVIPIVYTIAEDALSTVPRSLVSASMALGANRWQTAFSIILPTASAGILSGVIIGIGRAVGETMVLLMATGNTAVLDPGPFSSMRSLAANIAIELPEAPADSTLFRTLFLGAMVLFILTFIFNTFAEILRERLRHRYRVIE